MHMKKILFLYRYSTAVKDNLVNKFNGQMDACVSLGFDVYYINWNGNSFNLIHRNTNQNNKLKTIKCRNIERYYHTKFYLDYFIVVGKLLKELNYDYIYIRQMPFLPPLKGSLKSIKNKSKIIVEIPTYPYEEEYSKLKTSKKIAHNIISKYRNNVLGLADLLAVCGDKVDGKLYGVKAINFSNGINADKLPIRVPNLKDNEIHLLLLAGMYHWQGYDRLLKSIYEYKRNITSQNTIRIIAHFVGNDGDGSLLEWKTLAHNLLLDDNCIFHGAMHNNKLNDIFNICDLGIGGLGLYRKKLYSAQILKLREYMARGLPFVYAHNDESVKSGLPFCLQIANDASIPDMKMIIDFAMEMKKEPDMISVQMHNYAFEQMSWKKTFEEIMNALDGGASD